MKMQKRRSLAATVRLSLVAGVGALGWMALGATSASAADAPGGSGLLGSASGVVGSASAPAATAVQALTDPIQTVSQGALPETTTSAAQLGKVPLVPDVIAQVPQLVTEPAGTVVPPVASLVDRSVAAVPIVQSLVPAGTVTSVTSPVVTVADGAVGGISDPVLEVVAPVVEVIDPVVDVVAPVVEVVDPVVDVVAPGPEVIDPVVDVVAPGPEVIAPVVDVVAPGPANPPAGTVPAPVSAVTDGALGDAAQESAVSAPGSLADPAGAGDKLTVEAVTARGSAVSKVDRSSTPPDGITTLITLGQASNPVVSLDALVLPTLTAIVSTADGAGELLAAPAVTSASALSSAGGAGAGTPLAALGGAVLLMFMMLIGRGRLTATPDLPAGPSFDPGSSPD